MSAEDAKPVVEPTSEVSPPTTTTEVPAVKETTVAETAPVVEVPAKTDDVVDAVAPTEAKLDESAPVEPKEEGSLHYNAPSNFLRELLPLPPKKQFFWLGTGPVAPQELNHYLAKGKEAAHSTAAWASQTGTGLLYFSKHGDKKENPSGVLNLADAEDIKTSGPNEFSFKLLGQKHKFTSNEGERDGWVAAVTKASEEAKAKKDEVTGSEGYKEALTKLKPVAAVIVPTESTPKKSTDAVPTEETPAEEEVKKTSKSRSRSRGAPSNIIGFFKGKKEDVRKSEEPAAATEPEVAAPPATEAVEPVEPAIEPVTEPVAEDVVAPIEEKKEETKGNRRMSRFESFFKGKTGEKAPEPTPVVEPISDTPPTIEASEPTVDAPVEAAAEAPVEAVEKEAEPVAPIKEKKPSLLAGGFKSFTQKIRSPSSEQPPAAIPETAAVTEAAEVAEVPAAPDAPVAEIEPAPTNGDKPLPASPTDAKEKRKSSFFSLDAIKSKLPKKEEKVEEPAATEAAEEVAKPAEEIPAVAASEPEITEPKVEKEVKQSPLTTLGRRVSKAIRGDKVKKEPKVASKLEESSETAPQLPLTEAEPPLKAVEPLTETAPTSIGDVVPEAVHSGTPAAPPASATVSATA